MASPPPAPSGENFLTRKTIGGLPNWVLLAGGAVLIYVVVGRKKGQTAQQPAAQPSYYPADYGGGQTPLYVLSGAGLSNDIGNAGQMTGGSSGLPSAATPATDTAAPSAPSYLTLGSLQAVQQDIASGTPVYQSAQEAQAFDLAHGTPAGQSIPTSGYYPLSGAAAESLYGSGQPVYVKAG